MPLSASTAPIFVSLQSSPHWRWSTAGRRRAHSLGSADRHRHAGCLRPASGRTSDVGWRRVVAKVLAVFEALAVGDTLAVNKATRTGHQCKTTAGAPACTPRESDSGCSGAVRVLLGVNNLLGARDDGISLGWSHAGCESLWRFLRCSRSEKLMVCGTGNSDGTKSSATSPCPLYVHLGNIAFGRRRISSREAFVVADMLADGDTHLFVD